jgi:hypothetical protein
MQTGCDFSTAVSLFKPEELEINCGNIDELLLGDFIGAGFWREVYKASWKGAASRWRPWRGDWRGC